ncbi:MAG TPA: D-lyxose/D-mannose family sugar isomerase [Oscillospiraceae bacterium]|nr:D-lyxose/D-mannose family sugar isomerase [Oscillospiraceae bacterium]HPK35529.1 D-lyxose/D-mannose family sugar isomerase [Oscillospiraceae bacterium]HPR75664.1 D-lyxose/D-mannose family sugar isomerase [Oscillospiraceae bacterium]
MDKNIREQIRKEALNFYAAAHITLTDAEKERLEVADFGLNDIRTIGLEIITYVNTKKCCAKEMVLLPGQICPEHRHAPMADIKYDGKEETFRCRYGEVFLYVEGDPTPSPKFAPPEKYKAYLAVRHEVRLLPGQQYTIYPNTKHWFASNTGAVISEFSTTSYDEYDIFTDPNIVRVEK